MARGIVLDPTYEKSRFVDEAPTVRRVAGLAGATVGFRVDIMWRSWDWVADVWQEALVAAGAELRVFRSGARFGDEGERMATELAQWLDEVDLAVVGLAN
jgi:hypothetical protein